MTAKRRGKKKSIWTKILLAINFFFIAMLLLSYGAPYISPARFWEFAFLGISFPILVAVNLIFLLIWILTWRKYAWITLIALAIGFNHVNTQIPLRLHSKTAPGNDNLKILTFNINNFYGTSPFAHEKGLKTKITDFIAQERPDICCLQELLIISKDSAKRMDKFAASIVNRNYFYKNYYSNTDPRRINALSIFTKYPITGTGTFRLQDRNVFAIYADLEINGKTVRVYNVHLESIRFGQEDYSFYEHLTNNNTSENVPFSKGSFKIFSKLKKAFILRAEQVDILEKNFAISPYPILVCGDFNDTPASYTYHKMSQNLNDSYKEAGSGFLGSTYSGSFPSFRIDYILYSDTFTGYEYKKYGLDLSDHSPVSVKLKMN
ncbi:MAG: endonuclease/exonuclease/phosphatase family protein [Bacteroidota bacterium]|nr:endonuclease/exonuclease/phosphatase family protein [Bacteroidota bacterium]